MRVWRRQLLSIIDEERHEVIGNKGDAAEATRRIVAASVAPCELASCRSVYLRPPNGRIRGHDYDVRWQWKCRYHGCETHGTIGWYFANDGDDADVLATGGGGSGSGSGGGAPGGGVHAVADITVTFSGGPPVHYVAQEKYGISELRGDSRRELAESTAAALPGVQRRMPSNMYNAHVAAAVAASRIASAPPQQRAAQLGDKVVPQPRAPVAPSQRAMGAAIREANDVARDRDVWASCAMLAAEACVEDETTVYLQEFATTPRGLRTVTFTRASIACYRAAVHDEGSAFCDATGSVISDILVRPNEPAKNVHTFTMSVPTPAGEQLRRSKPLRVLTAHGTGMLSATEVPCALPLIRMG